MELDETTCLTSVSSTKPLFNSMVLAPKQKYKPMEQDRKPRNKPMHLWVPYFLTKEARIYNGVKTDSSVNGAGKTGQPLVKE